ncbi:MAG TPA: OmpH family outer membrane protein [Bacteroidales bacterium]|jgi:outer membrane protein|nr:OmpH family outer membrane protein [Bacteroidales bacterium]HOS72314.1 OmpH family outer membrane protein [Bacteroidales bacterium]HQH22831.1 OmpH family outer membrane protein [Bacteroidales bacterium]HQJ81703.1 OmpH family outer membrane protein [Bacteroidales bacterium]
MKRYIGIAALVVLMISAGQAQNFKFGHINSDELIRTLPEFDTANAQLEKLRQELINNLEIMSVELNNKSDAYNKESKNLTELVRQTKEQELIDLNRRIQEFQVNAQEQLQNKQVELFQPIYARVEKVISDVGKENGFLYIFDVAKGSLLYFDESKSTNVLALVKTKLGVK